MEYREFKKILKEEIRKTWADQTEEHKKKHFVVSQTSKEELEPYSKYGKINVPDPYFPLGGTIIDLKDWDTYRESVISELGEDFTIYFSPLIGSFYGGEFRSTQYH